LVGGPNRTAVEGLLVTNDEINVRNNRLEGNKYGITLFQDADRYCGSNDESSRKWCTLTGGKRWVAGESQQVVFNDALALGAPDLTTPLTLPNYTSCVHLRFGQGTID